MYFIYRTLSRLAQPFVPQLLKSRLVQGKEDAARLPERLGVAGIPRPAGKLLWIHAASVGEANAALPLIEALLKEHTELHVLLTTVTVTSAALMALRLPARALHQFAPVDTLPAVQSFIRHWRPDVALWVDSELWPNLIMQTKRAGAVMGIVNARMSERSFKRWRLVPFFIRPLLACFTLCFAQSDADAGRLRALGLAAQPRTCNLKYDAPPLACDEAELARLSAATSGRAVWLAASTHPGEEQQIADVHLVLKALGLAPLTVIVPRHASRGDEIAALLSPLSVAQRSKGEPITQQTDIYLADTMGELGLLYRLAPVVFIGGSLVAHGGQNPLEAARLGCAILTGPHMENFAAIMKTMLVEGAVTVAEDKDRLTQEVARLIKDKALCASLGAAAERHTQGHAGALIAITQELRRYLA